MSKIRFIVISLTLFCLPAQAARVSGTFVNAKPGDRVELFVPHHYVDGHTDTYWVLLDQQLTFSIEAHLPEPQVAFLVFNYNRLPIFLEPNDTLTIRADAFRFSLPVEFGGRSGANNRLLQQYFKENPPDHDGMNDVRFKIGHLWASVEFPINDRMEQLAPPVFKAFMDERKSVSSALIDDFSAKHPNALTPAFFEWLSAEITYSWAYHLLFYGHVYAKRHSVQPEFFDFLYEAPNMSEAIGSEWYRQFLQALIAWHLTKDEQTEDYYAGQYALAGEMLRGKPLAFFRSEMIRMAFTEERYREILPYYTNFVQTNEFHDYEAKVTGLYEKVARVSPGTPAPSFTANDVKGDEVSLAKMRGRVVYLNFWATWCDACLKKMEVFDRYAADLDRLGIEVVNISIDESPSKWMSSLAERGFKGRNLLASSGSERNIAAAYGVEAVPQYFIVGKNGAFADKASVNQPEAIKDQLLSLMRN